MPNAIRLTYSTIDLNSKSSYCDISEMEAKLLYPVTKVDFYAYF